MTASWSRFGTVALAVAGGSAAAGFVAGLALDVPSLRLALKPVPVLCLLGWVAVAGNLPRRELIGGGLAWSAVGDLLLAMIALGADDKAFFGFGLGAFLIAHLCYIGFFVSRNRRLNPLRLVPFLAWGAVVFALVAPRLGSLTIPVLVYVLVIVTMLWRAFCLTDADGRTISLAQTAAWGALLFGLSDTLIALDRFWQPIPAAPYAIILAYWAGQIGIARSTKG